MIRRRLRKLIVWGFLLALSLAAAGLGFAYSYITDGTYLEKIIRERARVFLPGSTLSFERVLVRPLLGSVELRGVAMTQGLDGGSFSLVRVPWISVKSELRSVWRGEIVPREVVVAQPALRLIRRDDGSWNLQGLLADPWPKAPFPELPTITINKATVEWVVDGQSVQLLHDVWIKAQPVRAGIQEMTFEAEARSDLFSHLRLEGTFNPESGRVKIHDGQLHGLMLSDALRQRIPVEFQPSFQQLGVSSGELDLVVREFEAGGPSGGIGRYDVDVSLRGCTWESARLPFTLNNVGAAATLSNGVVTLTHLEGQNGRTTVRARGVVRLGDLNSSALDLTLNVIDLELDDRLRQWTPEELRPLWVDFAPPDRPSMGRVNLNLRLKRAEAGQPLGTALIADLQDVAMRYRHFRYPIEHLRGVITFDGEKVTIDLATSIGNKPATGKGTIVGWDDEAEARLTFQFDGAPLDQTLFQALPPDVREIVMQFHPTGTVRGQAKMHFIPKSRRRGPEPIEVETSLDLNDDCSLRWDGLRYPIRKLSGHLDLKPESWVFTGMRGQNGPAMIQAQGRVDRVPNGLAVDLTLDAQHLPFNEELRTALPPAWQKTWGRLNPVGSTSVRARIVRKPGAADDDRLTIVPESDTRVRLRLTPAPGTPVSTAGKRGELFLPTMDDVLGTFLFDNGTVRMRDVRFTFRGAPVQFAQGTVVVRDSGQFDLRANGAKISKLRIDADLRQLMPPLMAAFAAKLDSSHPFTLGGNLGISWSGVAAEPAVCAWEKAYIVFQDNAIETGLPIRNLQGEISDVSGRSDGSSISAKGILNLSSVNISDVQVTNLVSPLIVGEGKAVLTSIAGDVMGGKLFGAGEITFDATPRYQTSLEVQGTRLEHLDRTLRGRQHIGGVFNAKVTLSGLGGDAHSLQGYGSASVREGDLGQLPWFVRLIAPLQYLDRDKPPDFDAADVEFKVRNGHVTLDPVKLTGNTISLQGRGTIDPQGDLDMSLRVLYKRDERLHIPVFSDVLREASGLGLLVRGWGPITAPKFELAPLPAVRNIEGVLRGIGGRAMRGGGRPRSP